MNGDGNGCGRNGKTGCGALCVCVFVALIQIGFSKRSTHGSGGSTHRPAIMVAAAYIFTALMLVLVNFETFRSKLPEFHQFFASGNWFYLAAALGITKVIHEFGHGLSCKYYGGECHEMGFMLLVFTPCLYCDVSDSWMLPSKWKRMMIGAGGMYIELILASTATFLWWNSHEGLFNQMCLNVMFVSSVSTLLFNANPLMRFDGYYILSDMLEIPNLRTKVKYKSESACKEMVPRV